MIIYIIYWLNSFKPSYINYIDNYLISPLVDNITIFIKNNAKMYLSYLINKINDEFFIFFKFQVK